MRARMWKLSLYMFIVGFILNMLGIVSHVVVSSFAKRWFGSPLPPAFTTDWFTYAWKNFDLGQVLGVTLLIVVVVVVLALAIGFPAAYILARRNFRFKSAILLLYFLPLVIPQMTYGIPLATTLYRYGVGGSVVGVILAVLVPMVPLAVFILMPFFEQISINLEWSGSVLGRKPRADLPANTFPADDTWHSDRRRFDPCQHHLEFRAGIPAGWRRIARRSSSPFSTTCLPAACGRSIRSMQWPSSIW